MSVTLGITDMDSSEENGKKDGNHMVLSTFSVLKLFIVLIPYGKIISILPRIV